MLFTTFMAHDDEGYVLWSMRQFCEGHPLYSEVYSQYGPVFYGWNAAWHGATGLVFTNESGRWITLVYWLIAAGACAHIGWRLTRSRLVAAVSAVLAFAALHEMIREPFHPGGFLVALAAIGAAICLLAVQENKPRLFAITAAAIGMAMALTKINVGAFFLIAAGSWLAINMGGRRWGWLALALTGLGAIGAPLGLMKLLLGEPWVRNLAVVFIAGALALLPNLWAMRKPAFTWKAWLWMALAGGVILAGAVAFCAGTGTPGARLLDAVLVAPTRHPTVSTYPIEWRAGAVAFAVLAAVLALADALLKIRADWRVLGLAALRLLGGFAVLWQLTGLGFEQGFQAVFQYGPALAWLMATPLSREQPDPTARGRSWLAWCALWQILQAYPVAGSQVSFGCFLLVPLLVVGCHDACLALAERLPRARMALIGGVALALIAVIANGQLGTEALMDWLDREPLGLPGAQSLRLTGSMTSAARTVSRNIAAHSDVLFTTPGMMSFNMWSEKPTPTSANATLWSSLLDDSQKQAIATRLQQDKSAIILSRTADLGLYDPDRFLADYQNVLRVGPYALWTRKGVLILPIGTVRAEKTKDGRLFAIIVASPTTRKIGGLHVRDVERHTELWQTAISAENPWRLTPVSLQAQAIGAPSGMTAPFTLPTYCLVQVPLDTTLNGIDPDKVEVVLTEPSGAVVEAYRINKPPVRPAD